MPLTSQPIVSLLNGVSQQPASLRHPTQSEGQINCLATLAKGLEKRPPLQYVAKIQSTPLPTEDQFWHQVNRTGSNQYVVSIEDGDIRVFALADGAEKTVNFTEFRFFCQDDAVATGNGLSRRVWIPTGTTTADFATSGIGTATVVWEQSATGAFAGEETTLRTDTTDTDAAVTLTASGNWVRARISAWTSGTIDAWIDWGDTSYLQGSNPRDTYRAITVEDYTFITNNAITVAMSGVNNAEVLDGSVQEFGDLTATPATDDLYEVAGSGSTSFDNYFVKYDGSVWREHVTAAQDDDFDQATMPHTLVDNGDGTFTFGNGSWTSRTVGDTTSAPNPPFVGKTINEVFFFAERIGLCAGETVSSSRTANAKGGGVFDFWRETATAELATDPIFRDAPSEKNSKFFAAVPFDEALVLFSPEAQFVLNADGLFTPQTARLDVSTEFTADSTARPVGVGQNVYFPIQSGDFTGVREYFIEPDTTSKDAANVTAHVDSYIPKAVFKMAGSTNEDIVCLISDTSALEKRRVYVYKFFWDGTEKAQSSWTYWELSDEEEILNIDFIGSTLYFIIERSDGIYLEKMTFKADPTGVSTALGMIVHLDRREELTGVYDGGNDWTTWTLSAATSNSPVVITGPDFTDPGENIPGVTYPSTTTVRKTGDWSDGECYVGLNYEQEQEFSEQFHRGRDDQADLGGRLQINRFHVRYVASGYFIAEVTAKGRSTNTYTFSGAPLGDEDLVLGALAVFTGTFAFPVMGRAQTLTIKLKNNTYKPSTFLSAQWVGRFSPKAVIQA